MAESGAIEESVAVARHHADQATEAAMAGPSPELARGFATLAHALVDDLPGS